VLLVKAKDRGVKEAEQFIEKKAANMAITKAPLLQMPFNFRDDAQNFIEMQKQILQFDERYKKKFIVQPDSYADTSNGQLEVIYDDLLGPYDLLMTKVDIKHGPYGQNVFYKMQALH
jgi:hypothetical protein